jgi:hypothetical protein
MAHPSKVKGSKFERDLYTYLTSNDVDYERLRPTGVEDEGDGVARRLTRHFDFTVVEAKAENKIDLPGYLRELDREKDHFAKHRALDPDSVDGVVVVKRRMAGIGKAYVVQTVDDYFGIRG